MIPPGTWARLSYRQRDKVKAIGAERKKKSAHKRKVAASSTEEETDKKTASDDAGSQFGRNAHKKGKNK